MDQNLFLQKANFHKIYAQLFSHYGPQHWWPAQTEFEVIVGAILTQSTNWQNVERAIAHLNEHNALTPERLYKLPEEELAALIRPAGYFRQKAKKLKAFVAHLHAHHQGNLSKMLAQPTKKLRAELLSIWGIGPETADSIVLYAAHRPVFVVDAYTQRIFTRLGLLNAKIPYEELQNFFMRRLPKSTQLFNEYHALIVRHGKETCRPKPLCWQCPLSESCAYARRALQSQ
ncbi:MAG: endonuclease III domain-containing protein [Candidatus Bipolaricaulota bacterium]|nr:endonuclease III domain-containing protein [Candidatus Bipolaricaulota bacterium]